MITIILTTFILGYLAIAMEHTIKINKAASALITGVLCWTVYILFSADKHVVNEELNGHLGGTFRYFIFFIRRYDYC
jgi:hypothetical protein